MKHDDWTVLPNDEGIRPAGPPDACLYCRRRVGEEHGAECVIRDRTVMVAVTLELVIRVPESWDAEQVEFHRNDSSWCEANWADELAAAFDHLDATGSCPCGDIRTRYLREATAEDEEHWGVRSRRARRAGQEESNAKP